MDPATAFSIVCGVLQVVDFGLSTAKTLRYGGVVYPML